MACGEHRGPLYPEQQRLRRVSLAYPYDLLSQAIWQATLTFHQVCLVSTAVPE
jgi:hypothetical protein